MAHSSTDDRVKTAGESASAAGHIPSHLRFWIPAAGLLWFDLWSKEWAFSALPSDAERAWIPGILEFRRSLNDAAVFGVLAGYVGMFLIASVLALPFVFYLFAHSARFQRALHVALAMILAGAIGNLYDRSVNVADVAETTTAAGERRSVIGVLLESKSEDYVRIGDWPTGEHPQTFRRENVTLRRQGVVRDFIKFIPQFPVWLGRLSGLDVWPWVFNVADASLVCGVVLLLLHSLLDRRAPAAVAARAA